MFGKPPFENSADCNSTVVLSFRPKSNKNEYRVIQMEYWYIFNKLNSRTSLIDKLMNYKTKAYIKLENE